MRRKAFTLTEILIGIIIMLILAGVMTLNSNAIGRQTAKREADRVAAYLQDRMRRADMTRSVEWFTITAGKIEARTGPNYNTATIETPLTASGKCSFSYKSALPLGLAYPKDKNESVNYGISQYLTFYPIVQDSSVSVGTGTATYTLKVHGEDGKTCDVIIGR